MIIFEIFPTSATEPKITQIKIDLKIHKDEPFKCSYDFVKSTKFALHLDEDHYYMESRNGESFLKAGDR